MGNRRRPAAATTVESSRTARAARKPLVVGIGASAGGLEALKALLGAMPSRPAMALIVVVHLDPTHESLLPELLAKVTPRRVEAARHGQRIEAGHVYVIPPNRTLTVHEGRLRVQEPAERRNLRGTIDGFFRSLAAEQRDRAVAVVLSGSGTEGLLGARAIKAEGGIVLVQTPESASQPGMPASVIASGLADRVLPPREIPSAILEYVRCGPRATARIPPSIAASPDLSEILGILRARTKHDFRGYKKGTLQRRIERRMGLQQVPSLSQYAELLRSDPAEPDHLLNDLLIGVTSFFRDPAAFDELASVIPGLVRERDPDTPIRVWVPGCATGEEAYSVAMLVAEQISAAHSACRMQIFATDLNEQALESARAGSYPESIALDVTAARLRRFFTHEDHRYVVAKSIRETVTVAVQNLLTDPPFSRLDLVSCRNLLIYLEPAVQEKVLATFHFALNPGGYLFLGSAEDVDLLDELFVPVSKQRRLFQRRGTSRRTPLRFALRHYAAGGGEHGAVKAGHEPAPAALADRLLIAHLAPAAVVVRNTGQIIRFYGAMDRYVRLPAGDATLDVVALARDALKPMLRAALHESVRHNRSKVVDILDGTGEKRLIVRVTIKPLAVPAGAEHLWLLIFEERPAVRRTAASQMRGAQPKLVRQLEAELRATKKEHQQLLQQLESSNEELTAANEEILSINEELQSTNEELVTSKEELQSMNEELATLNAQLQDKVHELTSVNDDLANLLVSTDIATVFLDTAFRIKRFTTAATEVLNLLPSDIDRPISHIRTNLSNLELADDARAVMEQGTPLEREAHSLDGREYLVRILPYRSSDPHVVQGVVLTLVDVTALKTVERDLRAVQTQLERANATLEERVAERTKWLTLLHEVSRAIDDARSWDEGLQRALQRICEAENWQSGFVYLPDRDDLTHLVPVIGCAGEARFERFHTVSKQQRYAVGDSLPGRVYSEGVPVWLDNEEAVVALLPRRAPLAKELGLRAAVAFPIRFGGDVIAVLELLSDQPHPPDELLVNLMNDVGNQIAKVLERERSTAQMADLVWREQQGLLHTLHDSLGQTLTGLGMLSAGLSQRIARADESAAATARQIAEQAQIALDQVRQLSRGLFPVEIDADSLMPALRAMAATTESLHKLRVDVEGETPPGIRDSRVATQIYRIAQEAVTNAVKHARAHTIRIELIGDGDMTRLRVIDDGAGMPSRPIKRDGLGLRIMQYRAASIGAALSIEPGTGRGTAITCTMRERTAPTLPLPG